MGVPDIHMQVQQDTGQIVAVGYFPTDQEDDNIDVIDIEEHHREALMQAGAKYLQEDGTIAVIPPELPAEVEQPIYGDDGDLDNVELRQAVANIRLYKMSPSASEETKVLCDVVLYLLKRLVRLA
jgi:hypothetical protein